MRSVRLWSFLLVLWAYVMALLVVCEDTRLGATRILVGSAYGVVVLLAMDWRARSEHRKASLVNLRAKMLDDFNSGRI